MASHKLKRFSILVALIMAFLAGCASSISNTSLPEARIATLTPSIQPGVTGTVQSSRVTSESTQILKPTISNPPTVSPQPTLSSENEHHLVEELQSEDCKLPCFLGIIPGKTPILEGRSILESLGGVSLGEHKRETDGALDYTYKFVIGNPSSDLGNIVQIVSLISDKGAVQIIDIRASSAKSEQSQEKFRDYWRKYASAHQIFLQMGPPDLLFSDYDSPKIERFGRTLLISYEKQSAWFEIYGTGKENNICPQKQAQNLAIYMRLSHKNSTVASPYPGEQLTLNAFPPVDEIFGVTSNEFYRRVLSDSSTCFVPTDTQP